MKGIAHTAITVVAVRVTAGLFKLPADRPNAARRRDRHRDKRDVFDQRNCVSRASRSVFRKLTNATVLKCTTCFRKQRPGLPEAWHLKISLHERTSERLQPAYHVFCAQNDCDVFSYAALNARTFQSVMTPILRAHSTRTVCVIEYVCMSQCVSVSCTLNARQATFRCA